MIVVQLVALIVAAFVFALMAAAAWFLVDLVITVRKKGKKDD